MNHSFDLAFRQLSDVEKAYIAGLFDGEAAFMITTNKAGKCSRGFIYSARIVIQMTNKQVLQYLHRLLRGTLQTLHSPSLKKMPVPHKKTMYRLTLCGNKTRLLLPQILPYLIVKKQHGRLLLEATELFYRYQNHVEVGYDGRIEKMRSELKKLNMKGNHLGLDQPQVKET